MEENKELELLRSRISLNSKIIGMIQSRRDYYLMIVYGLLLGVLGNLMVSLINQFLEGNIIYPGALIFGILILFAFVSYKIFTKVTAINYNVENLRRQIGRDTSLMEKKISEEISKNY